MQIIDTFAEADKDADVFMGKWDIKDGVYRLGCKEGEKYNLSYVLLREEELSIKLAIPTALKMGWI